MEGRATLIQSVTQSIPVYTMHTTYLPTRVCHYFDKLNRDFLWLLCWNRLLTNANEQRLRRHLCQIGTFYRCNQSLERLEHVFKQCPRAHQKRAKETKAKALTEEGGKERFAFDSFSAYLLLRYTGTENHNQEDTQQISSADRYVSSIELTERSDADLPSNLQSEGLLPPVGEDPTGTGSSLHSISIGSAMNDEIKIAPCDAGDSLSSPLDQFEIIPLI
ncbi:hypothetical protein VNO80_33982 [Phaseolus coccineus]|uniref:Reverse transcriptase zinc-binding domain-containing protein n=1 Tax=Phaseolus coccineus TaxID=3886 RepID=A0AAN9Q5Q1_PHACN